MTPPTPRTLYVSSIHLAAERTAVSLSRTFVRQTLATWRLTDQINHAELVASELVTNAVKTTGPADPEPTWNAVQTHHVVGVQLRVADTSLYVEVWDRGNGSPVIPEQSLDAEGGRGLFLVEALSKQWDIYRPATGGKIVWSELLLNEPVSPPPLRDALPLRDHGTHGPVAGEELELMDMALGQRVLEGLRSVHDTAGGLVRPVAYSQETAG